MKFRQVLCFCIGFPCFAHAQFENVSIDSLWNQGTVLQTSGETLKGELSYSPVTEVLQVRNATSTQSLSPLNVSRFSILSESHERIDYYSIPFDSYYSGKKKPVFFKVVHENESMAILSRYELIYNKFVTLHEVNLRGFVFGNRSYKANKHNDVQEIIYLADSKGQLVSFLQSYSSDTYAIFRSSRATKKSGGYDLSDNFDGFKGLKGLRQIVGSKHKTMEAYVKAENIDLTTLDGLKKYIDYYDQIKKK